MTRRKQNWECKQNAKIDKESHTEEIYAYVDEIGNNIRTCIWIHGAVPLFSRVNSFLRKVGREIGEKERMWRELGDIGGYK